MAHIYKLNCHTFILISDDNVSSHFTYCIYICYWINEMNDQIIIIAYICMHVAAHNACKSSFPGQFSASNYVMI